jgi:hypothetical protein
VAHTVGGPLSDLRAEIANLAVAGEHPSTVFIPQGKVWMRNHLALRLSGKTIDLYQHPIVFGRKSDLRGRWSHTSTLFVRQVRTKERLAAERIVTDLCHLLSFATMSQVRPIAYGYDDAWRRWTGEGIVSQWRPPIALNGESLVRFIERTWSRYRAIKRSRKLAELIHYLTLTDHPDQPLEVRMLLAFVALENMKGTWAHAQRIPYRRGQFLKTVRKHGKSKSVPWRFEELLSGMFQQVGMRPPLRRIVRIRNQIVHFGLTNRSFKANVDYYERTKALQHEYVLRLLGYYGPFLDYRTMSPRTLRRRV